MDVSAGLSGGHDQTLKRQQTRLSQTMPVGTSLAPKLEDDQFVPKPVWGKQTASSRRELCLLGQVLPSILVSPHRCTEQEREI